MGHIAIGMHFHGVKIGRFVKFLVKNNYETALNLSNLQHHKFSPGISTF